MQALGIVLFALGIGVSIMLHEAGHMATAKHYGMKVTQYFVGFGPSLWSFRRGETEYGVKAIPAGGFVKIIGMTPQEELDDPADAPRAMWRQPIGRRTVVLAAGSVTHFLLAILLVYAAAVFARLPNPEYTAQQNHIAAGTEVGYVAACFTPTGDSVDARSSCTASDVTAPAAAAGMRVGDRVVSVAGTPVHDWNSIVAVVHDQPAGKPVPVVVDRNGSDVTLTMTPAAVQKQDVNGNPVKGETVVRVGVGPPDPTALANVDYGPVTAIPATARFTWDTLVVGTFKAIGSFPSKIPGLVSAIGGAPRDPNGPVSVVGASRVGGEAFAVGGRSGAEGFLLILASLNLFIGIFNLFPLLPLDGGHIAVIWFEKARSWWAARRGRPDPGRVDYNKLMPVTFAVIILFGTISVLAIAADIVNPIRLS